MRGRALWGALALMVASGAWMVGGAGPAEAYVCAFDIKSPTPGSISGSSTVHFRGTFEAKHGLADRVVEVTFTAAPGPLPPPTVSRRSAVEPAGDYDVPVVLSRNGTYSATVRAIHAGTAPILNCDDGLEPERRATEASAAVQFKVSVQASPPRNVTARFDPGSRTATVTWERSGDPDIVGYTITKKVGSAPATAVSVGAEPLSWTDADIPSGEATITYSVQASRQGPDAGTTSLPSAPVAAPPLRVPAGSAPGPSPSTTTGGTGRPAAPGDGATSTTVPFALGPAVGGDTPPARAIPFLPVGELRFPESGSTAVPDGQGGYQPLIPYLAGGDAATQPIDGGDQAIGGRGSSREPGGGTPGLAYVASGLLSSVVAAHILWLRRQALRPEPAGVGVHRELETVSPPESEPSPSASPPPAKEASPFDPVRDEAPVDGPTAGAGRRPLRAVREPAVAAVTAAGAGAILRPGRNGREALEPVTPPQPTKRTPLPTRPIVVAVAAADRAVAPTADVRTDAGAARTRPGSEPEVRIGPAGRAASGGSRGAGPRRRRREDARARREAPMGLKSHEEAAVGSPAAATRTGEVDAPRARPVGPSEVAGSDSPADAPVEPEAMAIGNGRSAVRRAVVPGPEGEVEDSSESRDQPGAGEAPPRPKRSEESSGSARTAVTETASPLASGPSGQPAAPLEAAGAGRSNPEAADAELRTTLPPAAAAADDVEQPTPARTPLRSRFGRSRGRSTPWVAAEPIEPAKPVELVAGEAIDPGGQVHPAAATRTPGGTPPAGRAGRPRTGEPGRRSPVGATVDPGTGDPGRESQASATGDPAAGDPDRESQVSATGHLADGGAAESETAREPRDKRPVLVLRPKGTRPS